MQAQPGANSTDKRILIVDDDPLMLRLLERQLRSQGYEVLTAPDGLRAMRVLLDLAPPMVLTDWQMPEMNGIELCRTLRTHEGIDFAYVIMLTASADQALMLQAFEAGVDDFIRKPFQPTEILARLRAGFRIIQLQNDLAKRNRQINLQCAKLQMAQTQLESLNTKLHKLATIDELTGLANRRSAITELRQAWGLSERHDEPMSCIMLDVDHFKRFNDSFGHEVGDEVLTHVAKLLSRNSRQGDLVSRFGGEEFLVVCPKADLRDAMIGAQRLCRIVARTPLGLSEQQHRLTISVGVAERMVEMPNPDVLIKIADEGMYAAKRAGRNRVCTIQPLDPAETASSAASAVEVVETEHGGDAPDGASTPTAPL